MVFSFLRPIIAFMCKVRLVTGAYVLDNFIAHITTFNIMQVIFFLPQLTILTHTTSLISALAHIRKGLIFFSTWYDGHGWKKYRERLC